MSSSHEVGALPPAASSASLLIQTQFVEWTLTGAAIHRPSYLENAWRASGMTSSHPSASAIWLRLATTPSFAQSVISKPSAWTAVGGFPPVTRARRTVMACSPPPPETGSSFHSTPFDSRSCLRTLSAAASPPDVHQCRTSTLSSAFAAGAGGVATQVASAMVATRVAALDIVLRVCGRMDKRCIYRFLPKDKNVRMWVFIELYLEATTRLTGFVHVRAPALP